MLGFLLSRRGSLAETEYLLMVSRDLGYITPAQTTAVLNDVSALAKKLHGPGEKVEPPQ
jgi:four helix bundle protein